MKHVRELSKGVIISLNRFRFRRKLNWTGRSIDQVSAADLSNFKKQENIDVVNRKLGMFSRVGFSSDPTSVDGSAKD